MNFNKVMYVFSYVGIMFSWLAVWIMMYWAFFDTSIPSRIQYVSQNGRVFTNGDDVQLVFSVERHRVCPLHLERYLQSEENGGFTYFLGVLDINPTQEELGVETKNVTTFKIGLDVLPGEYVYFAKISYKCNPMQQVWPILATTPRVPITVVATKAEKDAILRNMRK